MEEALKSVSRREKSNSVVVRVKRRRDQVAPSSICIVDSSKRNESLKSCMEDLSTGTTGNVSKKRKGNFAVFHLVDTVLTESKEDQRLLDSETVNCMKKRSKPNEPGSAKEIGKSKPENTVWVTKGTKVVKSDEFEDVFLVDVHVNDGNVSESTPTKQTKATKIFSPISRQLDGAISSAYKSGDFSAMLDIISRGGVDVNYQRVKTDGLTALMVAAHHCNSRVVSKLLSLGADVGMGDSYGKSALDYVKDQLGAMGSSDTSRGLGSAMECSLLLHNAITVKDLHTNKSDKMPPVAYKRLPRRNQKVHKETTDDQLPIPAPHATESSDEYVYDIFCLQKPENIGANGAMDLMPPMGSDGAGTNSTSETDLQSHLIDPSAHILQIPGLHVDEEGNVLTYIDDNEQQHFVYDSDWSDLGDDEDPDSNDERFDGNDYPDEESDEDSDEDLQMLHSQLRTERNARQNAFMKTHGLQKPSDRANGSYDDDCEPALYPESDLDGYFQDDENAFGKELHLSNEQSCRKYEESHTGQVMRHRHVGFERSVNNQNDKKNDLSNIYGNDGFGGLSNGSESLRELWGELGYVSKGMGVDDAHGERLQGMAERSGLQFGSNMSEFDKQTGLAKYGIDLSDDEADAGYQYGYNANDSHSHKPSMDTIAYDSELDDDEDYMDM